MRDAAFADAALAVFDLDAELDLGADLNLDSNLDLEPLQEGGGGGGLNSELHATRGSRYLEERADTSPGYRTDEDPLFDLDVAAHELQVTASLPSSYSYLLPAADSAILRGASYRPCPPPPPSLPSRLPTTPTRPTAAAARARRTRGFATPRSP